MIAALLGLLLIIVAIAGLSAGLAVLISKAAPKLSNQNKALAAAFSAGGLLALGVGLIASRLGGDGFYELIQLLILTGVLALAIGFPVALSIARRLEKPRVDPEIFR